MGPLATKQLTLYVLVEVRRARTVAHHAAKYEHRSLYVLESGHDCISHQLTNSTTCHLIVASKSARLVGVPRVASKEDSSLRWRFSVFARSSNVSSLPPFFLLGWGVGIASWVVSETDLGRVWFGAYGATPRLTCGATPRLTCGGRFGRHTCGAECVARCGAIGHEPNTP